MLVEGFFLLGFQILSVILDFLGVFPDLPPTVTGAMDSFLEVLYNAVDFAVFFSPWALMVTLALLAVGIEALVSLYHIIMWTCRKIPFLAIE